MNILWHDRFMEWIHRFQLFLFDFDGLLVNTEHLHYRAYLHLLERHGYRVEWTFSRFCEWAHFSAEGLKEQIYRDCPGIESNWERLYAEKKQIYSQWLQSGQVDLMPGVYELLNSLDKAGICRCIVTHSPLRQVESVALQHRILRTIPHWITREDYV